ncbi:glycine betaine ABC transporter substrate-binding protein [Acetobacter conturbans]|uniref:Glycine/betaine ABC transporter substrate-binding protein n=1 Tax=Acetobacter conturbans TaxID=1737472 RepID=A0ABX0K6H4_9PROT|nr:glycine betaine ABC transporter substrate-binding protein [Acetobacter conturbans]NHN89019.1 glycine/betaine ABC transporter substrate-binding protein [Acetobacter conturbans]
MIRELHKRNVENINLCIRGVISFVMAAFILCATTFPGRADEPRSCSTVRIAEAGWSDNAAANGISATILEGMGYKTEIPLLSIAMAYVSMRNNKIDVFLGNWDPAGMGTIQPFLADGSVKQIAVNLSGGHFTFAVPEYTWKEGLQSFEDLKKWGPRLDNKIYGLESGNAGNLLTLNAIKHDLFGLSQFHLVESSEQGMLGTVDRMIRQHKPVVFLGWEPHPMNERFAMHYLSGGSSIFGADNGSVVHTVVRKGYESECPNVVRLFEQLHFSISAENTLMGEIRDKHEAPKAAALVWLKAHPENLEPWLDQVTTLDGKPALPAVRAFLGLSH